MADQQNRGGQKEGHQQSGPQGQKHGTESQGTGGRSDRDKRQDQMSNPDDATRRPTNEQW
jgi:hypothetical protein